MYILDEFYSGLDEKIIYGSKCSNCGKVYFPPKIMCKICFEHTDELIKLPPTGILKNYIKSIDSNKKRKKEKALYGLIQIDNSDTSIIMPIFNTTSKNLKPGMKVKVVWGTGKLIDTPHIIGFEPLNGSD